jgi:hypothetical protein
MLAAAYEERHRGEYQATPWVRRRPSDRRRLLDDMAKVEAYSEPDAARGRQAGVASIRPFSFV